MYKAPDLILARPQGHLSLPTPALPLLTELLVAKRQDLLLRRQLLDTYARSGKRDPYRLQQVYDSLALDEYVTWYLSRISTSFLVQGSKKTTPVSYEVIADDLQGLKSNPQLRYLDVVIESGNPGTARARLHLKLLEG